MYKTISYYGGMKMSKLIEQIAKKNGVTPKEVECEIKKAIRIAMINRNATPESKAIWEKLSPNGEEPSVEEFIKFCAGLL